MKEQLRTSVGARGTEMTVSSGSRTWVARVVGLLVFLVMYAVFLALGAVLGFGVLAGLLALFFAAWAADKIDPKQ